MSQTNNNRNGKLWIAGGVITVILGGGGGTTLYRLDDKVERVITTQQARGERLSTVESELRSLRAERERQINVRDKEYADVRTRLDRLEGRK